MSTTEKNAFAWTADEIRRVGHHVVELIAEHLTTLPDRPVFNPVPAPHAVALGSLPLPETGSAVDDVLNAFRQDVSPYPFGNGHPGFYGWVNSPPAVIGIFAEALAATMNPSVAGGNHAAVYIEQAVTNWFRQLLQLPETAKGLLVSGTSAASLTALGAARHAACVALNWDDRALGLQAAPYGSARPRQLLVYKSAEGHGCHQKAVEVLGLGSTNIRVVPTDTALRIIPSALDEQLSQDKATGHVPMAVIATAGTVNTGAIDPLEEIADVCARHRVWLHVDAAYGGPAMLLSEFQRQLAAISRADSVALDPHKWLYVPVDAGLVFVRDAAVLRDTYSLVPPYLRTDGQQHGVQGPPWFSEYGIEQTRPFRALKVWMALRTFGLDGYRRLIANDVALARYLADRVRSNPSMELWEPQGLSIVCFRVRPANAVNASEEATDALNRRVLSALQLGGLAFLSSTVLDGRFWLRACIVNPRASRADIDRLISAVLAGRTQLADV